MSIDTEKMSDLNKFLGRKIEWVKFQLPKVDFDEDEEVDEENDLSEWEKLENKKEFLGLDMGSGRILATPLGLVSASNDREYQNSYKLLTAHTNFEITKRDLNILNEMEGVEGLQPLGRYRFNIVVGYCFDLEEIKRKVEKEFIHTCADLFYAYTVITKNNNPEIESSTIKKLDAAVSLLDKTFYAIFVYPNESMRILQVDKLDANFCSQIRDFSVLQNLLGGYLHVGCKEEVQ